MKSKNRKLVLIGIRKKGEGSFTLKKISNLPFECKKNQAADRSRA